MDFSSELQFILTGLTVGAIYALIALGFTLIYKTCDIINFAQGEFVMLGGMLTHWLYGVKGVPLGIAIPVSIFIVTAIGIAIARFAILPNKSSQPLTLIIITIGLSIAIRGGSMLFWGKDNQTFPPLIELQSWNLLGAQFTGQGKVMIMVAVIVLLSLMVFFKYTRQGQAMLACAVNRTGSLICGINTRKMTVAAFGICAAIGAIAGVIITPTTTISYDSGIMLGLKGFCAAVFGGLSSFGGAVVGGLALGVIESLGAGLLSSQVKDASAFIILLLILFIKPNGLLGRKVA